MLFGLRKVASIIIYPYLPCTKTQERSMFREGRDGNAFDPFYLFSTVLDQNRTLSGRTGLRAERSFLDKLFPSLQV
jgi:hypothetical protein